MSNILVVGGAGFIGSHLTEELAKTNKVVVVDNEFLGNEENLSSVRDKITFYKVDYCNGDFIRNILLDYKIDYVYNFAGFSSAPMFDENEAEGYEKTIAGFAQLLRLCLETGVKRVLYASTSSLYGDLEVQKEDVKVLPPNFYAVSKYSMEHTARLFYEMYGLESIGFRFFSVYGRNEKYKGKYANLISQFLWAMQKGEPLIIYGDGNQKRDFTYVKDIVGALIRGKDVSSDYAKGSHYNVGTSENYTLNEMIKILEEVTGKKAETKNIENPVKNYVSVTLASTEKIEKDFGFKAKYPLREGLKDYLGVSSLDVLILAGGFARRLSPLTDSAPKPLLPVVGKPILHYILEKVEQIPNTDKIYISTNSYFKKHFENWLSCFSSNRQIELVIEESSHEGEKLGSVRALTFLSKKLNLSENILIIGGDNLFDFDLNKIIKKYEEENTPVIGLYDIKDIGDTKNFGVVKIRDDERIIDFQEKPENPTSTLISTCCYIFPKSIFQDINTYLNEGNNPDTLGSFLKWLSERKKVKGFVFDGEWYDVGNLEDYKKAVLSFEKRL